MFKLLSAAMVLAATALSVILTVREAPKTPGLVFGTGLTPHSNSSGTRNFGWPHRNGDLIAFCLFGVSKCGKEAADAFCHVNGFKDALTFRRNSTAPNSTELYFSQIKCWHGATTVSTLVDTERKPKFALPVSVLSDQN